MKKQYYLCILALIIWITSLSVVHPAGECPGSTPDKEALKLIPCQSAARNSTAPVSSSCCTQVEKMEHDPKCLCAVLLSNMAKRSGVKPEIAITIPKRCDLADRPVGYQCGAYTLP
ncbi:uncharacterized protein [Henckelia pumila]|uniref:uncharacterized protein n=1 Tax=Henckelia pumila TaxID=405737 RepID=UPI003C6DD378